MTIFFCLTNLFFVCRSLILHVNFPEMLACDHLLPFPDRPGGLSSDEHYKKCTPASATRPRSPLDAQTEALPTEWTPPVERSTPTVGLRRNKIRRFSRTESTSRQR